MDGTDIANALIQGAAFPLALYYGYFNQKSKYYKKTWVLVVVAVGLIATIVHFSLKYWDNKSASEAAKVQFREQVKNSVKQQSTLATSDVVFESPDGYRILIPNGYTYSKPTGMPFSLMAIKNFDTSQTPAMFVVVASSDVTNEEFSDKLKKGMWQKNSTTKFTDSVRFKNGVTEIDRVEMTSVSDNGPVRGIMLFVVNAGKNYAVTIGTNEELFSASSPEFERIISSFSLSKPEENPIAIQPSSAPPPQASELSQPKPVAGVPAAASTTELDAEARAKAREERDTRRHAAIERELEAKRQLKAKQSKCVYKPVMTDEDMAKCR